MVSLEEHVVRTGREHTIRELELAFAGQLYDPGSRELHKQFSALAPDVQEFVRELVVKVVDSTVFYTLKAFDYADDISIIADPEDRDDDLRAQFDFGDSYGGEGGWLARHAQRPRSTFDAWIDRPPDTSWLDHHPKADL